MNMNDNYKFDWKVTDSDTESFPDLLNSPKFDISQPSYFSQFNSSEHFRKAKKLSCKEG